MDVQKRAGLGKRLGRFVALLGIIFIIVMGVVVTQRLSEDSLALLVGLSCGAAAMLPTLVIAILAWRREGMRQSKVQHAPQAVPPVVVVTPQSLPGYGHQRSNYMEAPPVSWHPDNSERAFTIVGGEE